MNIKDFKVGQTVYVELTGNASRGKTPEQCIKEWKDNFQAFYDWAMTNGYADDLTIDRIENNGNYEPSNCRWVDRFEQMSNTRSNRNIEYKGKTQTLAQWARELNFPYYILDGRINNYGWSVEKAFETPIQKRGGNHKINCMQ